MDTVQEFFQTMRICEQLYKTKMGLMKQQQKLKREMKEEADAEKWKCAKVEDDDTHFKEEYDTKDDIKEEIDTMDDIKEEIDTMDGTKDHHSKEYTPDHGV
jgi:hypothetical protein